MTRVIDGFAYFWYDFMFISFGIGLIGLGYLFYWKHGNSDNPKKILKIGVVLLGQVLLTWIVGFGSLGIVQYKARSELISIMENGEIELSIKGHEFRNSEKREIIEILKTVKSVTAHHSSPTYEIEIEIIHENDTSTVHLNKDSEKGNEYWVFWDKYRTTRSNDIGRITNEKLKKY